MKCKRCSKAATRKTHDGPKPGKSKWYAWYFHCRACGWLYMPAEAIRPVKSSTGGTHKCHQCRIKFATDRELRTHKCHRANLKHARELERCMGHYGFYRPWLGY